MLIDDSSATGLKMLKIMRGIFGYNQRFKKQTAVLIN